MIFRFLITRAGHILPAALIFLFFCAVAAAAVRPWIETGITANPDAPKDHQNFGQIFGDRSNELLLNQAVLSAERTLDPKAAGFD